MTDIAQIVAGDKVRVNGVPGTVSRVEYKRSQLVNPLSSLRQSTQVKVFYCTDDGRDGQVILSETYAAAVASHYKEAQGLPIEIVLEDADATVE